jgi:hypothetical protein
MQGEKHGPSNYLTVSYEVVLQLPIYRLEMAQRAWLSGSLAASSNTLLRN